MSKTLAELMQSFIAFVGEGHVAFPKTLTELNEAVMLFAAVEEDIDGPVRVVPSEVTEEMVETLARRMYEDERFRDPRMRSWTETGDLLRGGYRASAQEWLVEALTAHDTGGARE